jgi:hypothetical protein
MADFIQVKIIGSNLHDYGKESGNATLEGGLTRF